MDLTKEKIIKVTINLMVLLLFIIVPILITVFLPKIAMWIFFITLLSGAGVSSFIMIIYLYLREKNARDIEREFHEEDRFQKFK